MFDRWISINKNGTIGTHSVGQWICDSCNSTFKRPKRVHERTLNNPVYKNKDICRRCVNKFVNSTEEYKEKQRQCQLIGYQTDPDRKTKISKTLIRNQVNIGEKNGMKSLIARQKLSNTRKQMMTTEYKKLLSERTKRAWQDGKFKDVKVGRCKWYAIQTPNGPMKVQGLWELKYAEYLLKNNISFYAHRGRITYYDDNGDIHSYYPDFYLPIENKYIDVKAPYFYKMSMRKFELIRSQYPSLVLDILEYKKRTDEWSIL